MKRATLLTGSYIGVSFLLASFLWIAGNIDYRDYMIYKGLVALVADHWREFVMVVVPLSLFSGWRGVVYAHRMRQKRIVGLWLVLEVTLMMAALGVLLNTVNLYWYGPYQTLWSKTSDYLRFAPVMILSYPLFRLNVLYVLSKSMRPDSFGYCIIAPRLTFLLSQQAARHRPGFTRRPSPAFNCTFQPVLYLMKS